MTLNARVYDLVRTIPPGRVATYGDVALWADAPRAARGVGWALAMLPEGSDVPWWRVINSRGCISPRPGGAELQAHLLRQEGVEVDAEGCLDLERFRWSPPD